jgi:nucleotide-binding universal stress UspA family protein
MLDVRNERVLAVWTTGVDAEVTLRAACLRARYRGGRVAVLVPEAPRRAERDAGASVAARVHEWAGEAPIEWISTRGSLVSGAIAHAARWRADVLVIGAGAHAPDVEAIVHHGRRPVLVARRTGAGAHVVAGTDLRDPALPIVRAAAAEARRTACSLALLHALEPPPWMLDLGGAVAVSAKWLRERRERVEESLRRALHVADVDGHAEAIEGGAAYVLDERARRLDAPVVVVGTRPRRGTGRVIGATASTLLQHGGCSVLVLPLSVA